METLGMTERLRCRDSGLEFELKGSVGWGSFPGLYNIGPWDPKPTVLGVRPSDSGVIAYYFVGFGDTGSASELLLLPNPGLGFRESYEQRQLVHDASIISSGDSTSLWSMVVLQSITGSARGI